MPLKDDEEEEVPLLVKIQHLDTINQEIREERMPKEPPVYK